MGLMVPDMVANGLDLKRAEFPPIGSLLARAHFSRGFAGLLGCLKGCDPAPLGMELEIEGTTCLVGCCLSS